LLCPPPAQPPWPAVRSFLKNTTPGFALQKSQTQPGVTRHFLKVR